MRARFRSPVEAPTGGIDRLLNRGEQVVMESRQHPMAVVASFFDAFRLLVPLALVAWGSSGLMPFRNEFGAWIVRSIVFAMLIVTARLVWQVLEWELARVVVTTEKVMHVRGVLGRRIASTPLSKVSELAISQPPVGRIFGYGRLLVDAPGGGRPLHGLTFLPDPSAIYRMIDSAARTERAHEGGAILDQQHESQTTAIQTQPASPSFNERSN